jgi:mono/diheme cytochrome c family protein
MIRLSLVLGALGLALLAAPMALPAPGAPAAPTVSPAQLAARGQALFSAKGCAQCHHHAAVPGSGSFSGSDVPDLTRRTLGADYLRSWLANPAAVRPNTAMPNLNLKPGEIEALVAFLRANQP